MRLGNREYRIALIVITIVLALPILMHAINGLNSRMLADDYCFAANVQSKGLVSSMNYYYYNWQGTFSSTAVQSLVALSGIGLVSWFPVVLIVGWWLGFIYLFWQICLLLNFQSPRLSALALATLVVYAILEGTPTVFQSLYWISGSVTYALPMVLFTIWCALILHLIRAALPPLIMGLATIVSAAFAALIAGFSPIFAVFEIGVLGLVFLGLCIRRPIRFRATISLLIISLVGAAVGALIMIIAPGNSVRQALFHKPDGLLALLGVNFASTASFFGIDLSTFSLIPNLVVLIVGGWLISHGMTGNNSIYSRVRRSPRTWLLAALGVAFVLLFGIFLPTSYNISGFPPGRALIIPHVVIVGLVLTWGATMALSLRKTAAESTHLSPLMGIAIIALLLIGPLLAAGKSVALSPKLHTFSTEWDARDASMRQVANQDAVTVPPFTVDLADYVNVGSDSGEFLGCLEAYYHVQKVTVQG